MSVARIGKIVLKASGTEVRVLHRQNPNRGENWQGAIIEHARMIAEHDAPAKRMVGFLVLGLFSDGTISKGWRYDHSSPGVVPRAMLPAYVAELVRRDLITGPEAEDAANHVIDNRF